MYFDDFYEARDCLVRCRLYGGHWHRACLSVFNTTFDIWSDLASDADVYVRQAVAMAVKCPPDVLAYLSGEAGMRLWVAENEACPPDVLRYLASSDDEDVRAAVAGNPSCPIDLLGRLAFDSSEWVRAGVFLNPSCPAVIREPLSADEGVCEVCEILIA